MGSLNWLLVLLLLLLCSPVTTRYEVFVTMLQTALNPTASKVSCSESGNPGIFPSVFIFMAAVELRERVYVLFPFGVPVLYRNSVDMSTPKCHPSLKGTIDLISRSFTCLFVFCLLSFSTGLASCIWSVNTVMSRVNVGKVWRWSRTSRMRTPSTDQASSQRNESTSTSECLVT